MGAATVRARVREWAGAHPDLAEVTIGAGATVAVLLVSLWQWGVTADAAARGASIGLLLGALVAYSYRRRRRAEEDRERERLDERLRLARELHDAVAGQVTVVGIQAAAARRVLATDPQMAALALERIEVASRDAVADLRRMLVTLRAQDGARPARAPDRGLLDVGQLVADAVQSGVAVEIDVTGQRPADLPVAVDQAAFRIVGESLTNVLKHAGAQAAQVTIGYESDAVALRIANGPPAAAAPTTLAGAPPAQRATSTGLGIVGMRERARLVGGTLTAGPAPDGGWRVEARLPYR